MRGYHEDNEKLIDILHGDVERITAERDKLQAQISEFAFKVGQIAGDMVKQNNELQRQLTVSQEECDLLRWVINELVSKSDHPEASPREIIEAARSYHRGGRAP